MNKLKRCACGLIAGMMLFGGWPLNEAVFATPSEETSVGEKNTSALQYSAYIAQYASAPRPQQAIRIEADDYIEASNGVVKENGCILTTGTDTVTFQVTVSEAGLYKMAFEFYTVEDYDSTIERSLYIDGALPFAEAEFLSFSRIWHDILKDGTFEADGNGDQLRPASEEIFEKQILYATDSSGYTPDAFDFYFSAGEHRITLQSVRESMKLEALILQQKSEPPAYQETLSEQLKASDATPIIIEAENIYRKSHVSVHSGTDSTSPLTSPQSSERMLINVLGGDNWLTVGQWIEWEFYVDTPGWYQIDCRYLQNVNAGLFSSREIMIDGELPFKEASEVKFHYGREWQVMSLGDENGAFAFYLDKGTHTLRMRAVLGEMAETLRNVENCVDLLNTIYREILFVTGVTADPYRTYNFKDVIPDTIQKIQEAVKTVRMLSTDIRNITGRSNSYTGLIDRLAFQLEQMAEDPEEYIASNFSTFKTNIGSLSSQLTTMKQQPLALDYITIQPYGSDLPTAEASFLSRFTFSFSQIIWSFFRDYSIISDGQGSNNTIVVWSSAGRDQTQILQQMILSDFAIKNDISVTMQLVPATTLLPAVLANNGPDVALFNESGRPVEFAVRGAVEDLSAMEDYDEVAARFLPAAVVPFSVGEKVYALPETQNIPILFYRKDILEELELSVPETWDDFYDMLSVLQKNNMNAGITMDLNGLCIFLYQMGGGLYNKEGTKILLDSNTGLAAFKKFCELYTKYKLPPTFTFVDRFRSGEMPIAIQDYSVYTQLSISAPELKGLWEMAPIPGIEQEDGSILRTAPTTGTAVMMLSNTTNKEASWEFMKWWTQADVQHQFSNELSILLGEETFFATANTEAFLMQQWSTSQRKAIMDQRSQLDAIPNVPGGYYTSRYVTFALANVYNSGEKPTEAILSYVEEINDELVRKRAELELLS